MLCECYDVTASQVTPYKQSTVPLLLQSCYMHVVHDRAASLQLVIRNELTRFCVAVNARYGFCPLDLEPFTDLIEIQDDQRFSAISHNPNHLLQPLLPPPSVASQNYELRHRIHNRSLPDRAGHLSDANFISRMIYKDKLLNTIL